MHVFLMYFAETSAPFSIVFRTKCRFFFHYILPGLHFFVMYFAATSTPFSILFCPESVFFKFLFWPMHIFVMSFAETSTPFSIVFCPRIRFFLKLYFAHNAFFRNVFCRNLYTFLLYFSYKENRFQPVFVPLFVQWDREPSCCSCCCFYDRPKTRRPDVEKYSWKSIYIYRLVESTMYILFSLTRFPLLSARVDELDFCFFFRRRHRDFCRRSCAFYFL